MARVGAWIADAWSARVRQVRQPRGPLEDGGGALRHGVGVEAQELPVDAEVSEQ